MQPLLVLLVLIADTTSGYLVPHPPGKYNVTLTTGPLVDYSRDDPYAATPTPRALMLSVFQPTACASTLSVPSMPREVAEYQGPFLRQTFNISDDFSPLFQEARLPVCPDRPKKRACAPPDANRILLFSPGYSIPRFYYNVLASAIASEGFTVITIDHPFDANILVYPDGHAVFNNATILDSPTWDEFTRAADASFVIDQLANATAMGELLPQRGPRPFPTDRVAMLGHSAGGASAIIAASRDPRIRGAVNWDGTIFGSPPPPGSGLAEPVAVMDRPVLFLSHQDFADPSWLATWPRLQGPKMLVFVQNTTHYTFSDMPTLLEAAGQSVEPLAELLGALAPARMVSILTAYTTAWVDGVFKGQVGGPLLKGEEPGRFPEALTLMQGNF